MKRYQTIEKTKNLNRNVGNVGSPYYITNRYPVIPLDVSDIYVITDIGDRLDLLSYQFYNDVNLYWVIAAANPNSIDFGSLALDGGIQLRIPINLNKILDSYIQENE